MFSLVDITEMGVAERNLKDEYVLVLLFLLKMDVPPSRPVTFKNIFKNSTAFYIL